MTHYLHKTRIIIILVCLLLACGILPAAAQETDSSAPLSSAPITKVDLGVSRATARKDACDMEHAISRESFLALMTLAAAQTK